MTLVSMNSVSGAIAYDAHRSPDAAGNQDGLFVSGLTGTSYTDGKVANGMTYTDQVAAVSGIGAGTQWAL